MVAMAVVKERYAFSRAVWSPRLERYLIQVGNNHEPLATGVTEAKAWRAAARRVAAQQR